MALKKNTTTEHGINLQDAYYRVDNIVINSKTNMSFLVNVYADKTAKQIQTLSFKCSYVFSGNNPIAQAYEYLKTLEEFAGAVDC
jgi:hypothetical protein